MAGFSKIDHRANRLLAAIDPDDYARLEPHLEIVDLPRGKVVYEAGEIMRHTYFPHDTFVSLVAAMANGATAEVAVFGCEGVFASVSASISRESLGRYVVQVPGTASRVSVERLKEAVTASRALQELSRRYLEALLAQTFQSVACNAVHSAETRCCRWILSTHDRVEGDTLPLTHEFLAEMLGVQRATVSIVTRTLQTSGLISQSRSVITVTDRAGSKRRLASVTGSPAGTSSGSCLRLTHATDLHLIKAT